MLKLKYESKKWEKMIIYKFKKENKNLHNALKVHSNALNTFFYVH